MTLFLFCVESSLTYLNFTGRKNEQIILTYDAIELRTNLGKVIISSIFENLLVDHQKFAVMLTAQNSSKGQSQYKHKLAENRICHKLNPRNGISCLFIWKLLNVHPRASETEPEIEEH